MSEVTSKLRLEIEALKAVIRGLARYAASTRKGSWYDWNEEPPSDYHNWHNYHDWEERRNEWFKNIDNDIAAILKPLNDVSPAPSDGAEAAK
jgi:hypothetical protein